MEDTTRTSSKERLTFLGNLRSYRLEEIDVLICVEPGHVPLRRSRRRLQRSTGQTQTRHMTHTHTHGKTVEGERWGRHTVTAAIAAKSVHTGASDGCRKKLPRERQTHRDIAFPAGQTSNKNCNVPRYPCGPASRTTAASCASSARGTASSGGPAHSRSCPHPYHSSRTPGGRIDSSSCPVGTCARPPGGPPSTENGGIRREWAKSSDGQAGGEGQGRWRAERVGQTGAKNGGVQVAQRDQHVQPLAAVCTHRRSRTRRVSWAHGGDWEDWTPTHKGGGADRGGQRALPQGPCRMPGAWWLRGQVGQVRPQAMFPKLHAGWRACVWAALIGSSPLVAPVQSQCKTYCNADVTDCAFRIVFVMSLILFE